MPTDPRRPPPWPSPARHLLPSAVALPLDRSLGSTPSGPTPVGHALYDGLADDGGRRQGAALFLSRRPGPRLRLWSRSCWKADPGPAPPYPYATWVSMVSIEGGGRSHEDDEQP